MDLAAIGEWTTVWLMPFNLNKCHDLHVGTANEAEKYSLFFLSARFSVT